MLLPQSSAFAALKNRLNSVSSIGYLHIAPRTYVSSASTLAALPLRQGSVVEGMSPLLQLQGPSRSSKFGSVDAHNLPLSNATPSAGSNFDRPNRLKGREEGIIRWGELLEKFRSVQERARRAQRHAGDTEDGPSLGIGELRIGDVLDMKGKDPRAVTGPPVPVKDVPPPAAPVQKPRSGLGRQFGRLGGAVSGRGKRNG
jgi:vacuole morphology and inheritance protein 14